MQWTSGGTKILAGFVTPAGSILSSRIFPVKKGQNGAEKAVRFVQRLWQELQNELWNLAVIFKPELALLGGKLADPYFYFYQSTMEERWDCH